MQTEKTPQKKQSKKQKIKSEFSLDFPSFFAYTPSTLFDVLPPNARTKKTPRLQYPFSSERTLYSPS
jgi:hypothetical protein